MKALLPLISIAACDIPKPETCDVCLDDPGLRCISVSSCSSELDCPRGTTCRDGECKPVPYRLRTAEHGGAELFLGAGVGTMSFEANGTKLHWRLPAQGRAELVHCVLFTCVPQVVQRTKRDTPFIGNFDKCAVGETSPSSDVFNASEGDFDVGDSQQLVPIRVHAADTRCPRGGLYVQRTNYLTDALAMCFAYDATSLIAASPMISVDPSLVALPEAEIPTHADCRRDGTQCYEAFGDRFGTCYDGLCRFRCIRDSDCPREPVRIGSLHSYEVYGSRARCVHFNEDPLGACELVHGLEISP